MLVLIDDFLNVVEVVYLGLCFIIEDFIDDELIVGICWFFYEGDEWVVSGCVCFEGNVVWFFSIEV